MGVEPTVIVAALALVGTVVSAFLAWRGARAAAQANQAKAHAEQVAVAVDALTGTVGALRTEATRHSERADVLEAKVVSLEHELRLSRVYEALLIQHINDRKPPPPPTRPAAA